MIIITNKKIREWRVFKKYFISVDETALHYKDYSFAHVLEVSLTPTTPSSVFICAQYMPI